MILWHFIQNILCLKKWVLSCVNAVHSHMTRINDSVVWFRWFRFLTVLFITTTWPFESQTVSVQGLTKKFKHFNNCIKKKSNGNCHHSAIQCCHLKWREVRKSILENRVFVVVMQHRMWKLRYGSSM